MSPAEMQQLWKEVESNSKIQRDPPLNGRTSLGGGSGLLAFDVHKSKSLNDGGGDSSIANDCPNSPGLVSMATMCGESAPPPLLPLPAPLLNGLPEGMFMPGK